MKYFKCQGRGHVAKECPNMRKMVIWPSGEIETNEEGIKEDMEDPEMEKEEVPENLILVTRRALSIQDHKEDNPQWQNIFYTRCQIKVKMCSIMINCSFNYF